jgi:pimeloyl-ACP methyl ester carboxylesterase
VWEAIEIPTRGNVTQRFLHRAPPEPHAAVILFAGGNGGTRIGADGSIGALRGNFLVRSRDRFAERGLAVVVIDAPSDRQSANYLSGARQTNEHVTDVRAVIAWLKWKHRATPVWLVGTSRGTQSVAHIATALAPADGGPDGIVLTASILQDPRGRPVPDMALERIAIPVLVAHHRQDSCRLCLFSDLPRLTDRLTKAKRTAQLVYDGGENRGDPCEAMAYHGFNGLEDKVVADIAAFVLTQ